MKLHMQLLWWTLINCSNTSSYQIELIFGTKHCLVKIKKHDRDCWFSTQYPFFSSSLLRKYQLFPTSVLKQINNNNKKVPILVLVKKYQAKTPSTPEIAVVFVTEMESEVLTNKQKNLWNSNKLVWPFPFVFSLVLLKHVEISSCEKRIKTAD